MTLEQQTSWKCAACGAVLKSWWSTAAEVQLRPPVVYCNSTCGGGGRWNITKKE